MPDGPKALPEEARRGFVAFTFLMNYTGFPAVSIPCGTVRSLPVGMQLVGRPGSEPMLLDLARQFGLTTERLEFATALALLYALRCAPPEDKECQLIRSLYERHGTAAAVLTYDGNYLGAPYPGLDAQTDAALLARIDRHFEALAAEGSSHWDWPLQEA